MVSIKDNLGTKKGIFLIFGPNIRGLYHQERVIIILSLFILVFFPNQNPNTIAFNYPVRIQQRKTIFQSIFEIIKLFVKTNQTQLLID